MTESVDEEEKKPAGEESVDGDGVVAAPAEPKPHGDAAVATGASPAARQQGPANSTAPAPRVATGRGVSVLALIVALVAAALAGWQYYQASFVAVAEPPPDLSGHIERLELALQRERQRTEQVLAGFNEQLQQERGQSMAALQEQLAAVEASLQQQRQRLLAIDSTDRSDWLLAEVEYLLRLANQRLVMADDQRSARALLQTADGIVRELDDASLHGLRAAIAADQAALRAIPELDMEGIWLRLQALVGQVDTLVLFQLPDYRPEVAPVAAGETWSERFAGGVAAAWQRLSSYVVIKRRDAPYEALLDPQWEGLVRQNLRMLLEQARSALLSGNAVLYSESLDNARRWLGEFFSFNEQGVAALDQELEALAAIDISRGRADLTRSLAAVKLAIDEKHQVGGDR